MDSADILIALSGKLQNANRAVITEKKREREEIEDRI